MGPSSTRQRHNDRGGPSSDTTWSTSPQSRAADRRNFLRRLVEAVPYKVKIVLTDNESLNDTGCRRVNRPSSKKP